MLEATCRLLERLIYNRAGKNIFDVIPPMYIDLLDVGALRHVDWLDFFYEVVQRKLFILIDNYIPN